MGLREDMLQEGVGCSLCGGRTCVIFLRVGDVMAVVGS